MCSQIISGWLSAPLGFLSALRWALTRFPVWVAVLCRPRKSGFRCGLSPPNEPKFLVIPGYLSRHWENQQHLVTYILKTHFPRNTQNPLKQMSGFLPHYCWENKRVWPTLATLRSLRDSRVTKVSSWRKLSTPHEANGWPALPGCWFLLFSVTSSRNRNCS